MKSTAFTFGILLFLSGCASSITGPTSASSGRLESANPRFKQFDGYIQKVIDIVQIRWERILKSPNVALTPKTHVVITFRLNASGEIAEILKVEGDAGDLGTNAALSAIRQPAPYRPWTRDMISVLGNDQVITFTFYYS